MNPYEALADGLARARCAWALTGAGVSTESGIPDFRSPQSGLWARYDPNQVASLQGFLEDPARFYRFWQLRFAALSRAEPNVVHRWLAELERAGRLQGVITQNIDGLHVRAGSRCVLELHGNYRHARCLDCRQALPIEDVLRRAREEAVPRCRACGGLLKPDVVLFGELLPATYEMAVRELESCDWLLVLGTSLEVYPAADLVPQVARRGGHVALINREPTPFDRLADVVIHDELGPAVTRLGELTRPS